MNGFYTSTATPWRGRLSTLALVLALLGSTPGEAVELRLEEDRIWLTAEEAPLRDILTELAQAGVQVKMDPAIDTRITAHAQNEDVEQVLGTLLENLGYVLYWQVIDGPLGILHRLSEIQVFRPEARQEVRPLESDVNRFKVQRLPDGSEYVADEILIGFAPDANSDDIRLLIRRLGGTVVQSLPELGIYRIQFRPGTSIPALMEQLRNNALVAAVEPNYAYRLPAPTATRSSTPFSPAQIGAPREGTAPIAILDSGLTRTADLEPFIAGGFNAINPAASPDDTAGHGTQMAYIASGAVAPGGAAQSDDSIPVLGIRTFDENGVTSNFAVMRSISHAVEAGARVVNMSWGTPTESSFLDRAAAHAAQSGLLLVAAAGNEPLNELIYPAAYDHVIAVSAALPDGAPWPQSNYGDFVDLAAPGTADLPIGYRGDPGNYAGTSIASAYTTHALGRYFEQNPHATANQAIEALIHAVRADRTDRDPHLGHGLLDQDALQRLLK